MGLKDVTSEQIVKVAEKFVLMYEKRVEAAKTGHGKFVNLGECEMYLSLWKSVVNKKGENLSPQEKREVEDAYYSGEFDG